MRPCWLQSQLLGLLIDRAFLGYVPGGATRHRINCFLPLVRHPD